MKLIKIKSYRQGIPFNGHDAIDEEHIINVEQIVSITQHGNSYAIDLSNGMYYQVKDEESINKLFKVIGWNEEERGRI